MSLLKNLRPQLSPTARLVLAFVAGVLLGWWALGWWLFPVKWTNAAPEHLHPTFQEDYLRMAIDSYQVNRNADLARMRFQALGSQGKALLDKVLAQPTPQSPEAVEAFAEVIGAAGQATPAAPSGGGGPMLSPTVLLGFLVCALGVIGLVMAGIAFSFIRRRRQRQAEQKARERREAAFAEMAVSEEEEALSHYLTSYEKGNDFFDESFSVELPTGEFLGEAGISLSETINTGQPKEVAAFEVWLFDKNDMQTVTKVLVLPNAPSELLSRVGTKGEVVEIQAGDVVEMETTNLRALVRIREMEEGTSPNGRYFERLVVEFFVWRKALTEGKGAHTTPFGV